MGKKRHPPASPAGGWGAPLNFCENNPMQSTRSKASSLLSQGRVFDRVWAIANQLTKAIGIPPNRIAEIVNNRRRITADTAL